MNTMPTTDAALHQFNVVGGEPPKILILDDEESDRIRLRRICAKSGLQADYVEAEDFRSFKEALDRDSYGMIFLDYHLGMETGLDALRVAVSHEKQAQAILIMVTSVGQHSVVVEAMKSGCSDYIVKEELSVDSLRKSISSAIERRILMTAIDAAAPMRDLRDNLTSFLNTSAPELQRMLAEMMRGVWRIRNSDGVPADVRQDTLLVTRTCGEFGRFLDDLKAIADATGDQPLALPPRTVPKRPDAIPPAR